MLKLTSVLLANIDDLSRLITIDLQFNVKSRKMCFTPTPEIRNKKKFKEVIREFIRNFNYIDTTTNLIKCVYEEGLLEHYAITEKYIPNLRQILYNYLYTINPQSPLRIEVCTRYSLDKYNGFKLCASKDVLKDAKLHFLLGYSVRLSKEGMAERIHPGINDYSVSSNLKLGRSYLLLGPISIINHDCTPNCKYDSTDNGVCITSTKPIKAGEEFLVYYGKDYFGDCNIECECKTCEKKKKEIISQSHDYGTREIVEDFDRSTIKGLESIQDYKHNVECTRDKAVLSNQIICDDEDFKGFTTAIVQISENACGFLRNIIYKLESNNEGFKGFSSASVSENAYNLLQHIIYRIESNNEHYSMNKDSNMVSEVMRNRKLIIPQIKLEKIDRLIIKAKMGNQDYFNENQSSIKNGKTIKSRQNFCCFCLRLQTKLPKHLRTHIEQKEIKQILKLGKKDEIKKNKILHKLRLRGNNIWNSDTKLNKGNLIYERKPRENINPNSEKRISCKYCKALYSKKTIWHHYHNCLYKN